jgi:predicted Zn-dependent protease
MKIARATALSLLLTLPAGAIELPDLGDVSRASLSQSHEDRIGREIMGQIRSSGDFLNDPALIEYLSQMGDALTLAARASGQAFQFFLVRDPSLNAFALPGGYIGVHTGLLSATRNESELAGVLAHEIAHVTQKHIARMVDDQRGAGLSTLAALALAILAARSGGDATQAVLVTSQALMVQRQLDFTRENEKEADRIGLQTMQASGYAPQGMASFFERLQNRSRVMETNAPAYLRTHPLSFERIADLQNRLADLPYSQHADSPAYLLARARVQAEEGDRHEAVKRFEALVTDRSSAEHWYGLARAALRTADFAKADKAVSKVLQLAPQEPMARLLAVEAALAAGRADQAADLAQAALKAHGGYRPLIYAQATALLRAGKAAPALARLDEHLRTWVSDARLYALRAEAHKALGHTAQSHQDQAELYLLDDRLQAAIEQLEFAQRSPGADFYNQSIIDARLRALRERRSREEAAKEARR